MTFNLVNLLQGIGIGIIFSIPLGPVGLITMKRTAEFGLRAGILSALAIVAIDTLGTIAILLGFHSTISYLHHIPRWMHLAGAVIIFIYGVRTFFSNPTRSIDEALPWHKHFLSSAVLALTTPSTYFSFGIVGLLLARFIGQPLFTRIEVIIGFAIGALIWWCALAVIAFSNRKRYFAARNIQRIVGVIIMVLAVTSLLPARFSPLMHFIHH